MSSEPMIDAPRASRARTIKRNSQRSDAGDQTKMLEVLKLFRIIVKTIRGHYQMVENRSGVSGAQLWALAHIHDHPRTTVGALAKALAIHQSTASNLIGRLESVGLVERRRLREDQRTVELSLTPRGKKSLARAPRPLIGVLQQALADMPMRSLDGLHQHLSLLVRTMRVRDTKGRSIPLSDM